MLALHCSYLGHFPPHSTCQWPDDKSKQKAKQAIDIIDFEWIGFSDFWADQVKSMLVRLKNTPGTETRKNKTHLSPKQLRARSIHFINIFASSSIHPLWIIHYPLHLPVSGRPVSGLPMNPFSPINSFWTEKSFELFENRILICLRSCVLQMFWISLSWIFVPKGRFFSSGTWCTFWDQCWETCALHFVQAGSGKYFEMVGHMNICFIYFHVVFYNILGL